MGSDTRYHYVYTIRNLVNNKWYGGKHSSSELIDSYPGSGPLLKKAYKKYGRKNFEMVIHLFFDTEDLAYEFEELLVDSDAVIDSNCYNLKEGGKGGATGYKHTPEAKSKISKYSKSRKASKETREKMSSQRKGEKHHFFGKPSPMKGRTVSDEVKKASSDSQKLRRSITGVSKDNGETVCFDCPQDARRALGLSSASNIIKAANKDMKLAYGYYWKWSDTIDTQSN